MRVSGKNKSNPHIATKYFSFFLQDICHGRSGFFLLMKEDTVNTSVYSTFSLVWPAIYCPIKFITTGVTAFHLVSLWLWVCGCVSRSISGASIAISVWSEMMHCSIDIFLSPLISSMYRRLCCSCGLSGTVLPPCLKNSSCKNCKNTQKAKLQRYFMLHCLQDVYDTYYFVLESNESRQTC